MPLPSRSQTNTRGSQTTKVDVEKGQNASEASGLSHQEKPAKAETSEIDGDPDKAPQECTREEALASGHLYPFEAVLKATGTDAEAGLSSGEVKQRQVSAASINGLQGILID